MLNRCRDDRGSALMLMPAAVLIMFVLGAIAVDLTAVRVGQRDLQAALTDAANDAVTGALDESLVRAGLGYHVDGPTAQVIAIEALSAKGALRDLTDGPWVTVGPDGSVTVTASRRVAHVFGRAIPGVPHDETVHATATASLERR